MITHCCGQVAVLPLESKRAETPDALRRETLRDVLIRFDDLLAGMGRAKTTRRLYIGIARAWLAAGGSPGRVDQDFLTRRLAARRRQVGQSTLNLEFKALRAFYRCMALAGIASPGVERDIPHGKRAPRRLPRWFTNEQVASLLAQPDLSTFIGLRDHVLIRLLYETGLRATEMMALRCTDLLPDGTVYVERGKGGHSRFVPIGNDMMQLMDVYLVARAAQRPDNRNALWIRADGVPLRDGRSAWEIVNRYARRALGCAAGYDRVRHTAKRRPWSGQYPHMLRAGFATALLQHGCPLPAIAQMLGHVNMDSTAPYLGTDLTQLRAAIAKHPRAFRR